MTLHTIGVFLFTSGLVLLGGIAISQFGGFSEKQKNGAIVLAVWIGFGAALL